MCVFQVSVIERAQDIADTETLRNSLGLLVLSLVECDVVVAADVLQWFQQVFFQEFAALLLLCYDRPLEVQVVWFFQDVEQGGVSSAVNPDFLEFVPEFYLA